MDNIKMNQITNIENTLTMTSREIAELTGKRHDHVMRDIKNMLQELEVTDPKFGGSYKDSTGRTLPCFNLPKRETLILVSGYSVELRAKIIDRWQELETKLQPQPQITQTPHSQALDIIQCGLEVAKLLETPLHLAQIEAVKEARTRTGVDYQPLLAHAPAQDNIEEQMLEPTELGKRFNLSGVKMNTLLEEHGLQQKVNNQWEVTPKAKHMAVRHSWTRGNKSGYNLKWNVKEVEKIINP